MNTNLQAVAVNVTLSKKVTICSIYLPPSDTLSKHALVNLIDQLPHPFMLVGDFNGHSKVWSCSDTNDRGEIIEDVIAENVFCWLPSHTNIRGNELADLEAKSALSLSITNLKIPHSDFKSNIHQYVMNKCQSVWEEQTGNKLHELKSDFNSNAHS